MTLLDAATTGILDGLPPSATLIVAVAMLGLVQILGKVLDRGGGKQLSAAVDALRSATDELRMALGRMERGDTISQAKQHEMTRGIVERVGEVYDATMSGFAEAREGRVACRAAIVEKIGVEAGALRDRLADLPSRMRGRSE